MSRKQEALESLDAVHEKCNLSLREYMLVRETISSGSFWKLYDLIPGRVDQWVLAQTVALFVVGDRGILFDFVLDDEPQECEWPEHLYQDEAASEYEPYDLVAKKDGKTIDRKGCIWLRDGDKDIQVKQKHIAQLAMRIVLGAK